MKLFVVEADRAVVALRVADSLAVLLRYLVSRVVALMADPDKAVMSEAMRCAVNRVSRLFPTSIISGRALEKVKGFVKLDHLYYAGSHGLDIGSRLG